MIKTIVIATALVFATTAISHAQRPYDPSAGFKQSKQKTVKETKQQKAQLPGASVGFKK
jgi:ABC-type transporter MlaC component